MLVRYGVDAKIPPTRDGYDQHTYMNVYRQMLVDITRTYNSLPDARELQEHEIEFFYDGIRGELKAMTKPDEGP